jgi:hypothetical protein
MSTWDGVLLFAVTFASGSPSFEGEVLVGKLVISSPYVPIPGPFVPLRGTRAICLL